MSAIYAFASANVRSLAGGAAAALLLALGAPASACDLTVEAAEAVRIDYNPFAIGVSSGPLDLVFQNRSDKACDLRLLLADDLGNPQPNVRLGGVVVEFRPREASGLLRRDTEPGAFRLKVPGLGKARAELDAAIVQNAVVEAGDHEADLYLVIQADDGALVPAPTPLRVILRSAPRAQVNIAGSAGAYGSGSSVEVVDFGDAVTGQTRRVFVQVRANAESTLSVKSEHRGVMRHLGMGDAGTVIAYRLALAGSAIDLSDIWTQRVDPPRTLDGVSLPLDFTLGEVAGQMSGRYEDVLTIDISPH